MNIQALYQLIRQNIPLERAHFKLIQLKKTNYTLAQLGALAISLQLRAGRNSSEEDLLQFIIDTSIPIRQYLQQLDDLSTPLGKTSRKIPLKRSEMEALLHGYLVNDVDDCYMAMWLMIVVYRGLVNKEVSDMTDIMSNSGAVYDYRNVAELECRKIIRRYPTGGVSEKIALIMPSLIAAFAEQYPIASNFLVARSLGHTGGTWDKLSVIPGFHFPAQGRETLNILKRHHVAMSVTSADCNPLDNRLYQLRSATGSVVSLPLITASIASKLRVLPVDFTLLDVRYGEDVFAQNIEEGRHLGSEILKLIQRDMEGDFLLTEVLQPDGMGIGNKLEVMEALSIMKNDLNNTRWNEKALEEQKNLLIKMFKLMMQRVFPLIDLSSLEGQIREAFSNGRVLSGFKRLLLSHGVSESDAVALIDNPEILLEKYVGHFIYAKQAGVLKKIDLKKIGLFVNFDLITGLNTFAPAENNGAGVILQVRLGDQIVEGDVLCEVIALPEYILHHKNKIEEKLAHSFIIE